MRDVNNKHDRPRGCVPSAPAAFLFIPKRPDFCAVSFYVLLLALPWFASRANIAYHGCLTTLQQPRQWLLPKRTVG